MYRFKSIGTKITVTIVFVVLITGIATILVVQDISHKSLVIALQEKGMAIGKQISVASLEPVLVDNRADLQELLNNEKEAAHDFAYAFILDNENNVLAHTFSKGIPFGLLFGNNITSGEQSSIELLDTEEGLVYDFATPIVMGKQTIGIVRVGISEGPLRATITRIRIISLGIILIVLVIGTLMAVGLTRLIVSPIKTLRHSTNRIIESDNLDVKVDVKTGDEIQELGEAFNFMAASLKSRREELVSANRQLEQDIIKITQTEERIEHLNLVLHAIRNVNQLITKEKDRYTLIREACNILIATRGYGKAWLVLMHESKKRLEYVEAGWGKDFLPLAERLEHGELPICGRKVLKQSRVMTTNDPLIECAGCPLSSKCEGMGTMTAQLEYAGRIYGLLCVTIPTNMATDEETSIFSEVAGDIALALNGMELEMKRKQAEHDLAERVKELDCLYGIAAIAERPQVTLDEIYRETVKLVPKSWQYPKVTCARLIINNATFKTKNWRETKWKQSADIKIRGVKTGMVEISYLEERPELDEGPFLKEERLLINAVAERLGSITERTHLEYEREELKQKAQISSRLATVGQMAAGIAHEINNPLTIVVSYTQLLLQKEIPEDIRKGVATIYEGAQRVASVIRRMLTFAGQSKPERTQVNINELLENTLTMQEYSMKSNGIELSTRLASDLPTTIADAGQLQQVFLNLILNAETEMGLSHGRGHLIVESEVIDNNIRVSFTDDGQGIAKDNLERIFDPFFTTREVGQGTGLGLSICYGILTEHRGRIYADSELGKGATFVIEVPIVSEPEKEGAAVEITNVAEKIAQATILVVDDEPGIARAIKGLLSEEGYEVETAENAQNALQKMKSQKYNLILLDIKLPDMSGIELYHHIQETTSSLAKKVVFITGDVMGAGTMDFLSKSKLPYIAKPFDNEELKEYVNRMLAGDIQ